MQTGSAPEQSNDYFDFELEIGIGSGREYPVHVVRSIAGEARETMHFPFDTLVLENRLLTLQKALLSGGRFRRIPSREEQTVQDFGQALFNALFTGEVRTRYAVSQREASRQEKGLRVKLRIQSPQLAALPWEFLYDAGEGEYVCLSRNTPIVRYIELPQPPQPLSVTLPLRILGMIVSPQNLPPLDVEREKLRMEEATKELQKQGLVSITWLQGQTWQVLQQAMRRGPWHVFHFIGHGGFDSTNDEGLIALANTEGYAHYFTATQLGRLLRDHRSLRLVVLNSCEGARGSEHDIFSSTASILVRRGIPAVLAMQYEITDSAAIELAHTFYDTLAEGMPVDMAVGEARKAISFGVVNTIEWGTPVLYMRSPDGSLFNIKERQDIVLLNKPEQVVDNFEPLITPKPTEQDEKHSSEQKQEIDAVVSPVDKNVNDTSPHLNEESAVKPVKNLEVASPLVEPLPQTEKPSSNLTNKVESLPSSPLEKKAENILDVNQSFEEKPPALSENQKTSDAVISASKKTTSLPIAVPANKPVETVRPHPIQPSTTTSSQSSTQAIPSQNSSVGLAVRNSNKPAKRASRIVVSVGLLFVIIIGIIGVSLSNSIKNDEIHGTATASTQVLLDGRATAQIHATAIAFSIPPKWKVALDDPLLDNSKGYKWTEACNFISGSNHVGGASKNTFTTCVASPDFSNFIFQVQLIILKGDCGGVLFRVTGSYPNQKFYKYEVCQNAGGGTTSLARYLNDKGDSRYMASILSGRSSVSIKLNQPVTVAVIANGSTIRMYLNQQIDYAVSDSAYIQGQIALIALDKNSDTEVAYTNAKVWTP